MKKPFYRNEDSCLKPVGTLSTLIEKTLLQDFVLFTLAVGKQMQVSEVSAQSEVIIGFND